MIGSHLSPSRTFYRAMWTPEAAGIVLILTALAGVFLLGGCSSGARISIGFMGAELAVQLRGPDLKAPTAKVEAGVDATPPPAPATDSTSKPDPSKATP